MAVGAVKVLFHGGVDVELWPVVMVSFRVLPRLVLWG